MFLPGLVAGWWLALFWLEHLHFSLGYYTYAIFGCIVVGVTYAGVFAATWLVISRCGRYKSQYRWLASL